MTAAARQLTLGADQPATAGMVLRQKSCTAQCLLAVDGEAVVCRCPCRGRHHGVLRDCVVPGSVRKPKPDAPDEPGLFPLPAPPARFSHTAVG